MIATKKVTFNDADEEFYYPMEPGPKPERLNNSPVTVIIQNVDDAPHDEEIIELTVG